MEPVKTCATCRHSTVGRRDPMDWWKLRLCAHPGLVDRVEGRPLYSCVDARGREGACAAPGTLWEAVPVTVSVPPSDDGIWGKGGGPRRIEVYEDKTQAPDPVDVPPPPISAWKWIVGPPGSRGEQVRVTDPVDEAFQHTEVKKTFTINPSLLPRKPAQKRKPRAPREAIE